MDRSELQELVRHPAEALGLELKRWLDPGNEVDSALIARTLIAMRNFDGGIFMLGLSDTTGEPAEGSPTNVREIYHPDIMQGIVGKFARPSFEIEVHFIPRDSTLIPVVVVPGGVKAPVMARRTVREKNGKVVLEQNAVYVRCLANDTASSSKPVTHRDWEDLFSKSFANREVDVGQFIQRHIPNLIAAFPNLGALVNDPQSETAATKAELQQRQVFEFLEFGRQRYERRLTEEQTSNRIPQLPPHGAWEVAFTIADQVLSFAATNEFLDRLFVNQPQYTGWPCWIDTRSFQNALMHPYPFERGWEALIVRRAQDFFYNHIDFWRIEP